jgi:nickel-dependent lactate racemase
MQQEPSSSWRSVGPEVVPGSAAPVDEIAAALRRGDRFARLCADSVTARQPVTIIVNDPYRSTMTGPALAAIARCIARSARPPRFRVLVATGAHRIAEGDRRSFEQALLQDAPLSIEQVCWHDSDDPAQLGTIEGAVMNRWVVDGLFLLPIGSIEPHYFAGVTGPHKTLTIGTMARRDIERNHAQALHPAADLMRLHGNPVFEDVAALAARLAAAGKRVCAISQVVSRSGLVHVSVGDPIDSLHLALPAVARAHTACVDGHADAVHLKVASPLDRNLYQADKALKNNHALVRDRGGIILEADCPEGVGSDRFLDALERAPDHRAAKERIEREGYALTDHKVLKLRHLTDRGGRGVSIALVAPGVTDEHASVAGMTRCRSVAEARLWLADAVPGPLDRCYTVEDAATCCIRVNRG